MELRLGTSSFTHHIAVNNDAKAILEAVKKDLEILSYDEIEGQQFGINISFSISQTAEENEESNIFVTKESGEGVYYSNRMYHINMQINSNFKNTFDVLREQGYYAEFISNFCKNVRVCRIPVTVNGSEYTYKNDTGKSYEFMINTNDCTSVNPDDAFKIAEKILYEPIDYIGKESRLSDGTYYLVYCCSNEYQTIDLDSHCFAYTEESMPEYLKKYIYTDIKK